MQEDSSRKAARRRERKSKKNSGHAAAAGSAATQVQDNFQLESLIRSANANEQSSGELPFIPVGVDSAQSSLEVFSPSAESIASLELPDLSGDAGILDVLDAYMVHFGHEADEADFRQQQQQQQQQQQELVAAPLSPPPIGYDPAKGALKVDVLHKPRGFGGEWHSIQLGEGVRCTKGKGKWLKLDAMWQTPPAGCTSASEIDPRCLRVYLLTLDRHLEREFRQETGSRASPEEVTREMDALLAQAEAGLVVPKATKEEDQVSISSYSAGFIIEKGSAFAAGSQRKRKADQRLVPAPTKQTGKSFVKAIAPSAGVEMDIKLDRVGKLHQFVVVYTDPVTEEAHSGYSTLFSSHNNGKAAGRTEVVQAFFASGTAPSRKSKAVVAAASRKRKTPTTEEREVTPPLKSDTKSKKSSRGKDKSRSDRKRHKHHRKEKRSRKHRREKRKHRSALKNSSAGTSGDSSLSRAVSASGSSMVDIPLAQPTSASSSTANTPLVSSPPSSGGMVSSPQSSGNSYSTAGASDYSSPVVTPNLGFYEDLDNSDGELADFNSMMQLIQQQNNFPAQVYQEAQHDFPMQEQPFEVSAAHGGFQFQAPPFAHSQQPQLPQPVQQQPYFGNIPSSHPPVYAAPAINSAVVGSGIQQTYLQFSDRRLKTDVRSLTDAISVVTSLKGKSFRWRVSPNLHPAQHAADDVSSSDEFDSSSSGTDSDADVNAGSPSESESDTLDDVELHTIDSDDEVSGLRTEDPSSRSSMDSIAELAKAALTRPEAAGARRVIGFIAQEVREVCPEVVTEDPITGFLSVSYAELVPYLVEAFKEHLNNTERLQHEVQNQLVGFRAQLVEIERKAQEVAEAERARREAAEGQPVAGVGSSLRPTLGKPGEKPFVMDSTKLGVTRGIVIAVFFIGLAAAILGAVLFGQSLKAPHGVFSTDVLEARNLPSVGVTEDVPDSFVEVRLDTLTWKTDVVWDTNAPQFHEQFSTVLPSDNTGKITYQVYDADPNPANPIRQIGYTTFDLADFVQFDENAAEPTTKAMDMWMLLSENSAPNNTVVTSPTKGELHVLMEFTPPVKPILEIVLLVSGVLLASASLSVGFCLYRC